LRIFDQEGPMDKHAYYLLLSAVASAAIAGCDDSCPHTVVTKEGTRDVMPDAACQSLERASMSGYDIAKDCSELCDDRRTNYCLLPDDYLAAFRASNGPLVYPTADASVPLVCPTWDASVTITCQHIEQRGKYSEDCPIDGRRPQNLRPMARSTHAQVGDYLARSAHLEAASVIAFEQLARDLALLGAPAQLIADCRDAAREEVEHARVIGALARARGAAPSEVELGVQRTPSVFALALENVIEGVVRETYGALQAIVRARTAAAPDVRAAMAQIARDEASHAALSARIAVWCDTQLSPDERAQVAVAKRTALAELRRELAHEPTPALRDQLGLPPSALAASLVDQLELLLARH
jgi:hypothetical protein